MHPRIRCCSHYEQAQATKSSQGTQRYAHLATDTMRAAIERIGQKIPRHRNLGKGRKAA